MSKVKKVIFEDEDALQSIEDLKGFTEESKETSLEDIERLFVYDPIQVEEVQTVETTIEVIPLRDDSFSFGGTRYYLTKGKRQRVPIVVRDFLLRNKQSPRIKDIW